MKQAPLFAAPRLLTPNETDAHERISNWHHGCYPKQPILLRAPQNEVLQVASVGWAPRGWSCTTEKAALFLPSLPLARRHFMVAENAAYPALISLSQLAGRLTPGQSYMSANSVYQNLLAWMGKHLEGFTQAVGYAKQGEKPVFKRVTVVFENMCRIHVQVYLGGQSKAPPQLLLSIEKDGITYPLLKAARLENMRLHVAYPSGAENAQSSAVIDNIITVFALFYAAAGLQRVRQETKRVAFRQRPAATMAVRTRRRPLF